MKVECYFNNIQCIYVSICDHGILNYYKQDEYRVCQYRALLVCEIVDLNNS